MLQGRAVWISLAAIVWLAGSAAGQARPDFSGRWTSAPEPAASAAQPGAASRPGGGRAASLGSGWGTTISVTPDAQTLTVEYAFFGRGDMQPPLRFAYALDGSETKNSVMMGRGIQEQKSRAAWDGERLIITTLHAFTDPASGQAMTTEVKQVLSLDTSASLVVETTRSGVLGGPASTTRTVYRKL